MRAVATRVTVCLKPKSHVSASLGYCVTGGTAASGMSSNLPGGLLLVAACYWQGPLDWHAINLYCVPELCHDAL